MTANDSLLATTMLYVISVTVFGFVMIRLHNEISVRLDTCPAEQWELDKVRWSLMQKMGLAIIFVMMFLRPNLGNEIVQTISISIGIVTSALCLISYVSEATNFMKMHPPR
jgi:hypothetical protein